MVIIGATLSVDGMLFIATQTASKAPIYLMIPLIVIIFIVSQKSIGKIIEISLENSKIQFLEFEIPLNEIQAYYIDDKTSMSAFNFKLKNGFIHDFTITTTGKWKEKYFDLINDFKDTIRTENPDVTLLEYREVYPISGRIAEISVFIAVPVVLIIDLIALVTFLQGKPFFPWQVVLVNISLLTLIPYIRKSKG